MKIFLLIFLLPLQLFSQELTGIWVGNIRTTASDLPYELVISKNNEKLSGYSLMVFTFKGSENVGVKSIKLKNKNGNISIEDDELVYNNYTTPPKRVKLTGVLLLEMKNSDTTLSGRFQTRSMDFRAEDKNAYTGTIELVKQNISAKTKLIRILEQINLLNGLSFSQPKIIEKKEPVVADIPKETPKEEISSSVAKGKKIISSPTMIKSSSHISAPKQINTEATTLSFPKPDMDELIKENIIANSLQRKTEVVRSVFFKSDSLVLSLYDNGIVDGDTVSVVMNGKVIIANQGLTTKPIRFVIHATPELGDSLLITMVAENLGSIPPNTGLIIVEDGDDRSEIRFTGDMQMSSAVLFKRKH